MVRPRPSGATMTNHWSATSSMVSRASATPEGGYPQSSTVFRLGLFFPGAGSSGCPAPPGQVFCRALTAGGARSAVAASRANLPRCVDHLRGDDGLAVTQIPFVNEEASASVPRWKQGLSDAVPDVSWSWLSGCRPGAEEGRHSGRGARRGGNAGPGREDHSAASRSGGLE
jgi:hypothetical protein